MAWVIPLHIAAAIVLAIYALHQAILLVLYLRKRGPLTRPAHIASLDPAHMPRVTIQLPLYNERYMARRVIEAALSQTYPADKLHIQVLDDSTDDTATIARDAVASGRKRGFDITWIHRANRVGFKAGALANGFALGTGDLIAIFDADFVPDPDFLERVITRWQALGDARIGFVQTRWDYRNRDESGITRGQALVLDMHFIIEQFARCRSGLLMAFNGSGGIWRRACIEEAGGWQHDTLTEDLDLSYRAALRGWRGHYFEDERSPGDLPHDVLSYKRQQARWSGGTLQTIRKLLPALMRARLPLRQKAAGVMHLSGYFVHPLILIMSLTTPLLLLQSLLHAGSVPSWVNAISLFSLAPLLAMALAHAARGRSLAVFLRDLPMALLLGVGISFSNTLAMLRAILSKTPGEFVRTPKTNNLQARYRMKPDWTMWIELALALYTIAICVIVWRVGSPMAVMPVLLYTVSFGGVWFSQIQSMFKHQHSHTR